MKQELNKDQALDVLLQTARLAQSRGALTLEESEIVLAAVRLLTPNEALAATQQVQEEVTPEVV